MSRSYKKPFTGVKKGFYKHAANKILRHVEEIGNGGSFRKFFCSYKICENIDYSPETLTAYRK